MAKVVRRHPSVRFPDLFDWRDSPWATMLPLHPAQTFRVEDYVQDNRYVVRAELPGVDPEKDIEVTVEAGTLMSQSRRERATTRRHTTRRG